MRRCEVDDAEEEKEGRRGWEPEEDVASHGDGSQSDMGAFQLGVVERDHPYEG